MAAKLGRKNKSAKPESDFSVICELKFRDLWIIFP